MDNKNYTYWLMVRLWQLVERSGDLGADFQQHFFSDIYPKLLSVTQLYDAWSKAAYQPRSASSCVLRKGWKFSVAERTVSETIFNMVMARPDEVQNEKKAL